MRSLRTSLPAAPGNAAPDTRHNWLATQKEAVAFAPTEAAASFLPILLARLGASSLQVGMLSAIPNLTGFLLAAAAVAGIR